MKKCNECGKEIPSNVNACPNCGNPLNSRKYDKYIARCKNNPNIKNTLMVICAVSTLLTAVIGATFAYFTATSSDCKCDCNSGKYNINNYSYWP